VTGALLYNRSCFAQVLEGPLHAIERTFERIQRDTRHTDVTVLDLAEITLREFPAWSMAFAGRVDDRNENFASLSAASIRRDGLAAEHLLDLLHGVMLQEEEVVLAQTA
jgi:hypothetical protein